MKVLVIGQGGREHAIVKSLSQSHSVIEVHAIPGNDGMAREALCHKISIQEHEQIIQFCLRTEIDYVFIGPEDPLVEGLADRLRERGILVVGPSAEGARLEGSKIFAKEFMREAQVPTSHYEIVNSVESTLRACADFTPPYVLKADGLAAGKGVYICQDQNELKQAAVDLFEKKILGAAGERALLEQFMPGWELSFLVLTNGADFVSLPLAQDHKRLRDGQTGPNTGGMGTVAPLKIDSALFQKIETDIVAPSVHLLNEKQITYRGILFVGVMVTESGPQVLEYNVRLGDPETQVILPLVEGDTGVIFKNLAQGKLPPIRFKNLYSCCVILAAEGYPQAPKKGVVIDADLLQQTSSSYFIHAGTAKNQEGRWITNGGRVLGAVGLGSTLQEAIQKAYAQAEQANWPGRQMRTDIGKYF
jgi:phosphoribosylamine--glycine ligase